MASLVVPAISVTIILSSFKRWFTRDDLPALGFPIIAILVASKSVSNLEKSIKPTILSNKSPRFFEPSADVLIKSSKPNW